MSPCKYTRLEVGLVEEVWFLWDTHLCDLILPHLICINKTRACDCSFTVLLLGSLWFWDNTFMWPDLPHLICINKLVHTIVALRYYYLVPYDFEITLSWHSIVCICGLGNTDARWGALFVIIWRESDARWGALFVIIWRESDARCNKTLWQCEEHCNYLKRSQYHLVSYHIKIPHVCYKNIW